MAQHAHEATLPGLAAASPRRGTATVWPAPRQPKLKLLPTETAREALGKLELGGRVLGFTKGQFSLIDLMQAVLEQTGPADVTISTWSTGIRDAESVEFLRDSGLIHSCLLLLDYSFPNMRAGRGNAVSVLEAFGAANIRCARNHAKFVLIRNDCWNVAIRSSMNLNRNPRFEQFDLDDSAAICDFMASVVDEVFERTPAGYDVGHRELNAVFTGAMGGGLSSVYRLPDGDDPDAVLNAMLRELAE
ncbi:MAG: hypothetical protein Q7R40_09420 [Phaeospirillum sp.]|nr:hypothetical protein [Phaeospirillum sp.]